MQFLILHLKCGNCVISSVASYILQHNLEYFFYSEPGDEIFWYVDGNRNFIRRTTSRNLCFPLPEWNTTLDWAQTCTSQLPAPYCYYQVTYILSVISPGSFIVDIGSEGT